MPMKDFLRSRGNDHSELDSLKLKQHQTKQATQCNKGAKNLPILEEGDTVRLKPFQLGQKTWNKVTVLKHVHRRNRVHLKQSNEKSRIPLRGLWYIDDPELNDVIPPNVSTEANKSKFTELKQPKTF